METPYLFEQLCESLKLPLIRKTARSRAEEALRHQHSHLDYLISLLEDEWQERLEKRTPGIPA